MTSRSLSLQCPCGELLDGVDEDALVEAVQQHLRSAHPHLEYTREQILLLSY